jgi:hypothetical protein
MLVSGSSVVAKFAAGTTSAWSAVGTSPAVDVGEGPPFALGWFEFPDLPQPLRQKTRAATLDKAKKRNPSLHEKLALNIF